MASFAVAGVFTYACTVFLSLHAWTSWFSAFWPNCYCIVSLHVATTLCLKLRENVTFWYLFPIHSITRVVVIIIPLLLSHPRKSSDPARYSYRKMELFAGVLILLPEFLAGVCYFPKNVLVVIIRTPAKNSLFRFHGTVAGETLLKEIKFFISFPSFKCYFIQWNYPKSVICSFARDIWFSKKIIMQYTNNSNCFISLIDIIK